MAMVRKLKTNGWRGRQGRAGQGLRTYDALEKRLRKVSRALGTLGNGKLCNG